MATMGRQNANSVLTPPVLLAPGLYCLRPDFSAALKHGARPVTGKPPRHVAIENVPRTEKPVSAGPVKRNKSTKDVGAVVAEAPRGVVASSTAAANRGGR